MKKRRVGRPRDGTDVRQAILEAARLRFNASGYRGATLRLIAADAGVDAAMIGYYFGSKHALLKEVVQLRADPARIIAEHLDGPLQELPREILRALLGAWERAETRPTLLVQLSEDAALGRMLKEFIETELIEPISARIEREGIDHTDAQGRAVAFASQMVGLIFARYVIGLGAVAEMSPEELIDAVAPGLEAILR